MCLCVYACVCVHVCDFYHALNIVCVCVCVSFLPCIEHCVCVCVHVIMQGYDMFGSPQGECLMGTLNTSEEEEDTSKVSSVAII